MALLQHTRPSLCQTTSALWISCQQALASKHTYLHHPAMSLQVLGHASLASSPNLLSYILSHEGRQCCRDDDFGGDAVVPLKMGKRDSFLLADDISLLLGSQSSLDGGEHSLIVPSRWIQFS